MYVPLPTKTVKHYFIMMNFRLIGQTMRSVAFLLVSLLLTCCSQDIEAQEQPTQTSGMTLVVYFSSSGDVRNIVSQLSSQIDADVEEVKPVVEGIDYAANNYREGGRLMYAIRENPDDAASYPALQSFTRNVEDYDNIIIGTPLWGGRMSAIMQAYLFLQGSKMAGKKIALIVSSHSTGISGVVEDARRLIPGGIFEEESLWIHNSNRSSSASLIAAWLPKLSFKSSNTTMTDKIYLTIDGVTKTMTLVDNAGHS